MTEKFPTRAIPAGSRNGGSVISDEFLDGLMAALKNVPEGEMVVFESLPRPTKGSASSLAYQVKKALAKAPRSVKVTGKTVPVDPAKREDSDKWFAGVAPAKADSK